MIIVVFAVFAVCSLGWRIMGAIYAISPAFVVLLALGLAWYNGDLAGALRPLLYVGPFVVALACVAFFLSLSKAMGEAVLRGTSRALSGAGRALMGAARDRMSQASQVVAPRFTEVHDQA